MPVIFDDYLRGWRLFDGVILHNSMGRGSAEIFSSSDWLRIFSGD
jgi:hypothetical protein